jgi:hypothetical protein
MPIGATGVAAVLPELRAAFERAGRNPAQARLILNGEKPEKGRLAYYQEVGAEEAIFPLPSAGADVVLPLLDEIAAAVRG